MLNFTTPIKPSRATLAIAAAALLTFSGFGCGSVATADNGAEATAEENRSWSLLPFADSAAKRTLFVVPAGHEIAVRTAHTISTRTTQAGEAFAGTLAEDVVVRGQTVIPAGSRVTGRVVFSERSGRVKGVARMGVQLAELQLADGSNVQVSTSSHVVEAKKTYGKDAQKVGVGAGVGALIGAVAGGGSGAAKGAGVGAGAGTGAVLATRGDAAEIRAESLLRFQLEQDVEAQL